MATTKESHKIKGFTSPEPKVSSESQLIADGLEIESFKDPKGSEKSQQTGKSAIESCTNANTGIDTKCDSKQKPGTKTDDIESTTDMLSKTTMNEPLESKLVSQKDNIQQAADSASLDNAIEKYLDTLEKYQGLKSDAAKSFSNGFLEFGLANSRSRSALDKYFIDERVGQTADLTVKIEGSKLSLQSKANTENTAQDEKKDGTEKNVEDEASSKSGDGKQSITETKPENGKQSITETKPENGKQSITETKPQDAKTSDIKNTKDLSSVKVFLSSGGFSSGYAQSLLKAQAEFRKALESLVEAYQTKLQVEMCEQLIKQHKSQRVD